ncbi:MAG: 5'-nucleotidase C-terminal domain-containing protein [Aestuariivirga sp.]
MRKFIFGMLTASTAMSGVAFADTVKITFLGVGDVYNFDNGKLRGGMARLNAVARAEKAANPNTVYVMDGDMLSPSLLSGFDKGENMINLSNVVPFDLAVPGNHEFDAGPENFAAKIKISKFPWAAINITTADGKAPEGLGGVMMKDVSGVKVALVPVAEDETPTESSTADLKFGPTADSAIAAAKQARKDGADLVVGVVHAAHSDDQAMFNSKAFDILLSGHDHDLIMQYNGVTAYVETSTEANYLVPIDVTVNVEVKDGKRNVSWQPSFRYIDTATVQPDPESQKIVDGYKADLGKELDVSVGKTEGPLDSRREIVRTQESAMGNLIADAMRDAAGADVAITNGGGIRGNKQYSAGSDFTRRDVLTEMPFGNVTVLAEVTGKQILGALENGFSQVEDGAGRFPQVSGMVVTADLKQAVGSRVVSVTIGGKPLDPAASYKLATNDFMLNGGDGYVGLNMKTLVGATGGKLMANDVMAFIKKQGSITAKVEGQIVLK